MRPLTRLSSVLVTFAALTALAACTTGGHPEPSAAPSSTQSSPSPRIVRTPTAPDGGVVRVVESGFSGDVDTDARQSFGAVLENTSESYVVSDVPAKFRFLDSAGQPMALSKSFMEDRTEVTVIAREILPGSRRGVAFDEEFPNRDHVNPARVVVEAPGAITWIPISILPVLTVSGQRYETDAAGNPTLSFTLDSEYRTPIDWPDTVFIFRDSSGAIIGGRQCIDDDLEERRPTHQLPRGRSTQRIAISVPVVLRTRALDLTKTEVYLNPLGSDYDKEGKQLYRHLAH